MKASCALLVILAACRSTPSAAPTRAPAPPPAPPATDLVSPASASGISRPHGLDWPPEKARGPGKQIFKNATLLGDLPAERLMIAMQSMEPNLGAGCDHCHQQGDFAADTKKPKEVARAMLRMAGGIDERFFGGRTEVTCFTCHRHKTDPTWDVQVKPQPWPLPQLSEADSARPAREVYKNVKVLGDMPAGRLGEAMQAFSAALGVGCIHCHTDGRWAADDKPAKGRAREMLGMVHDIGTTWFAGEKNPVRCGTCHRGSVRPARTAGPTLVVHATLAGGTPAPRALLVIGPAGWAPATRAEVRTATRGPDADKYSGSWVAGGEVETEIGHLAPGSYSLCSLTAPADPNPANDPKAGERPVTCAPIVVAPTPDTQTVTRELAPLL